MKEKYRIPFHVQGFFPTYEVRANSEKEALNSKRARLNTAKADFGELQSYNAVIYGAFREGTNEDGTFFYTVTYKADGYWDVEVEAENEEEAYKLATELSYEADFGDLEDIDWWIIEKDQEPV